MNSTAFADIGPTAPSKVALARRIRKARECLKMAEDRLNEDEPALCGHWLRRAANEACDAAENED